MTNDRATREKQQKLDNPGKAKKRYQKPAFRYERVFETLALSCGKIAGTSANCNSNRKSS
jgi:hypothetical protein